MIKSFTCFILLISILNVSIAQKDTLSQGAKVLFNRVPIRLSDREKNSIFDQLFFILNKDNQTFHQEQSPSLKIWAYVYPVDLNNNGEEQIFVTWGTDFDGSGSDVTKPGIVLLFIKNKHGVFKNTIAIGNGTLPRIFKSASSEYPDLMFPIYSGNNSLSVSLYTWNGKSAYKEATSNSYQFDKGTDITSFFVKNGTATDYLPEIDNDFDSSIANYKFVYHPFKMRQDLIVHSTDNAFKWFTWGKAPAEINAAAMDIFIFQGNRNPAIETLAQECDSTVNNKLYNVQVSVVDLDNNGICGLIIKSSNISDNTSTTYLVCENGYVNEYAGSSPNSDGEPMPNDFTNKIEKNGLFAGDRKKTLSLFSYDTTSRKINSPTLADTKNLTGGSTPAELGKLLFKALKTNDKKLWLSCIRPDILSSDGSVDHYALLSKAFDDFRNYFIQQGVDNWNLLTYSRTTFAMANNSHIYMKQLWDENVASGFKVEFYYNNKEFIGAFDITLIATYNKGNYFMAAGGFADAILQRNPFNK